jgi:putative serine/threonine protein kinase
LEKETHVAIKSLVEEPYASIICYPKPDKAEKRKRVNELQRLGITALEFCGEKEVFGLHVLGKGCVGIVVLAYRNGEQAVLKIRRLDADRIRMKHEAEMLAKANSANVGPKFLNFSRNFLLMQYVDGDLLPEWLDKQIEKVLVKRLLREILEQCWSLDLLELDHGELSHAPKHVIVDEKDKPFIVDFESASLSRRPSNVTSICQFLFISGLVAKRISEILGKRERKAIIDALRRYKNERTRENFESVTKTCGL